MVCSTCNDLHPRPNPHRHGDNLSISIHDCLRSARTTSCDTCKLLADVVQHFHAEEEDQITIRPEGGPGNVLSVAIYADLDENDIILTLFVPVGHDSGHELIGSSSRVRRVLATSDDEAIFDIINGWVEECEEDHNNCSYSMTPMPTRVLDVGLDDETPFLLETEGKTSQYATLSYCWGKTSQLKTTKARLEEFKEALPLDELSLVVTDAIEICRRIYIPYLWVDALCIVQDDEEDWATEASRMCDVYSSSFLTIAAAGTPDNSLGIYSNQYFGSSQRSASFPFRGGQVYARVTPFQDHLGHPLGLNFEEQYSDRLAEKSWSLRPQELPLVRRAWTVQERILSSRVLYFTLEELWWECDSWWHCECGYAEEEKYPDDPDDEKPLARLNATQEANRGAFDWLRDPKRRVPLTLDTANHKWSTIVTMFAAGDLTYAKDKLPALAGLAQQFHRTLKDRFDVEDTYLAGMWRRNLERQLLWVVAGHIPGSKPLAHRPRGASIPTWSWMSVDGHIHYVSDEHDQDFKPRFRILEASIEPAGREWSGIIKGGKLVLEAVVVHDLMLADVPRHTRSYTVQLAIPSSGSFTLISKDTSDDVGPGPFTCVYAASMDRDKEQSDKNDECVPERIDPEAGNLFFVLKVSTDEEGAYERVGIGIAALAFMTRGLWDDAKKETVTIV
ncbi:HET-domain-containing protein [Lophiostoma macrostomum CBS 122681]|uniref:HET-domain-containing protein n=1 Tax=Lophiostoma macrostomum CBS 122681 TaxID=1314788 RepID=A0A6A6TGM3_9PLEO|nr:HET-domain-containing protein [Lophiostoma macrostomum CBS 122681]